MTLFTVNMINKMQRKNKKKELHIEDQDREEATEGIIKATPLMTRWTNINHKTIIMINQSILMTITLIEAEAEEVIIEVEEEATEEEENMEEAEEDINTESKMKSIHMRNMLKNVSMAIKNKHITIREEETFEVGEEGLNTEVKFRNNLWIASRHINIKSDKTHQKIL